LKALIQRVKRASVNVDGTKISEISKGILVFLGVEKEDVFENAEKLADKICKLRIFEDENENHFDEVNLALKNIMTKLQKVGE